MLVSTTRPDTLFVQPIKIFYFNEAIKNTEQIIEVKEIDVVANIILECYPNYTLIYENINSDLGKYKNIEESKKYRCRAVLRNVEN